MPQPLSTSSGEAWDDLFISQGTEFTSHTEETSDVISEENDTGDNNKSNYIGSSNQSNAEQVNQSNAGPVVQKSVRQRQTPAWMNDYASNFALNDHSTVFEKGCFSLVLLFFTSLTTVADLTTFKQPIQYQHWIDSMNCELDALERNGTWIITTLPPGKQAISCRWLYKPKFKPDGTIDRFKSRLVILGCKQKHGIVYGETFAPVAKMATVRTLLAVATVKNWNVIKLDVTNAFLHGDLEEEVFMSLP